MKLGPIHLLRDKTVQRLTRLTDTWQRIKAEIRQARDEGNLLGVLSSDHTGTLCHSALLARIAPPRILGRDPADEESVMAVERVVAAYHRAQANQPAVPGKGMWQAIAQSPAKQGFFAALKDRDIPTLRQMLARMFQSDLIWRAGA